MSQTRRLAAILAADVAGFPAKIANSRAYGRSAPVDSLVERNGFELPVPRENGYRSESSGFVYHNFGMRAAPTSAIQFRI